MLERKDPSFGIETHLFLGKFNLFLSIYEGWCPPDHTGGVPWCPLVDDCNYVRHSPV
jgi:hypothetical protein